MFPGRAQGPVHAGAARARTRVLTQLDERHGPLTEVRG